MGIQALSFIDMLYEFKPLNSKASPFLNCTLKNNSFSTVRSQMAAGEDQISMLKSIKLITDIFTFTFTLLLCCCTVQRTFLLKMLLCPYFQAKVMLEEQTNFLKLRFCFDGSWGFCGALVNTEQGAVSRALVLGALGRWQCYKGGGSSCLAEVLWPPPEASECLEGPDSLWHWQTEFSFKANVIFFSFLSQIS